MSARSCGPQNNPEPLVMGSLYLAFLAACPLLKLRRDSSRRWWELSGAEPHAHRMIDERARHAAGLPVSERAPVSHPPSDARPPPRPLPWRRGRALELGPGAAAGPVRESGHGRALLPHLLVAGQVPRGEP